MTQTACSCHQGAVASRPEVTAEQTVAEVAHRSPLALELLKTWGINHCCGAHLTLAEAAAAAGVPVDTLVKALNEIA